ncbi:hypothetical protein VTO42DRAFT_4258 [Malbranchea cinnamomea]
MAAASPCPSPPRMNNNNTDLRRSNGQSFLVRNRVSLQPVAASNNASFSGGLQPVRQNRHCLLRRRPAKQTALWTPRFLELIVRSDVKSPTQLQLNQSISLTALMHCRVLSQWRSGAFSSPHDSVTVISCQLRMHARVSCLPCCCGPSLISDDEAEKGGKTQSARVTFSVQFQATISGTTKSILRNLYFFSVYRASYISN